MIVAPLERSLLLSTLRADGGIARCEIPWVAGSLVTTWRKTGEHELRGRIAIDSEAATWLLATDLMVIRLERAGGSFDEWLVTEARPRLRGAALDIVAAPARAWLGTLAPVTRKYPGGVTPTDTWSRTMPAVQFWLYELQPANGALPSWISKGTWADELLTVTVAADRASPLALLLELAAQLTTQTGVDHVVDFRPTSDTTYELVIATTLSTREIRIEEDRNLDGLRTIRRPAAWPTILSPKTSGGLTMADAWFRVASGASTTWVLEGWDGGGTPVPFDDCWNGRYLQKLDGSLVQITDCTAPATIVVASGTGIAVGNHVQLALSAGGLPSNQLADPLRSCTLYAPRDYATGERTNFLRNATFADWLSGAPVGWTVFTSGGATIQQATNTAEWEYGGASARFDFDGVTAGAPSLTLRQTFPMPHRLRNKVWSCHVRAYASGGTGLTLILRLKVANGSGGLSEEATSLELGGRAGIDDWLIAAVQYDESAAGVGAWTGGLELTISQAAVLPSRIGYVDVAVCALDAGEDVIIGSEPSRLTTLATADLVAGRSPLRYEADVVDRARVDWSDYAHEAFEVGATARLVAPSQGLDLRVPIAELSVQELERAKTRLLLADVPARLSAS